MRRYSTGSTWTDDLEYRRQHRMRCDCGGRLLITVSGYLVCEESHGRLMIPVLGCHELKRWRSRRIVPARPFAADRKEPRS